MPKHNVRDPKTGRFTSNSSKNDKNKGNYGVNNGKSRMFPSFVSNQGFGLNSPDLLINAIGSAIRKNFLGNLFDERRDIDEECGYKKDLAARDYKQMFLREGIPRRIIDVWPKETWKLAPEVFDVDSPEENSDFKSRFKEVANQVGQAEKSFFVSETSNPLWESCKRGDILAGIGSFGAMYLGFDDVDRLEDLVRPVAGFRRDQDGIDPAPRKADINLNFIQCFDETQITISLWDENPNSPRFQRPLIYEFQLFDATRSRERQSQPSQTMRVHWSRVIHLAVDNTESNLLFSSPRLEPLWNRAYDLVKYFGAGGEGYYKGAFPGIAVKSQPDMAGDLDLTDEEKESIRSEMDNYQNKLQRYLMFLGLDIETLDVQAVDFSPQFETVIDYICATINIPKPVFLGHETGELNSTQNTKSHKENVAARRDTVVTPNIIRPLIDRLISVGVLPEPQEGKYKVRWPTESVLSPIEQASLSNQIVNALIKYVNSGLAALMNPMEFMTRIMKFDEGESQAILKDVDEEKLRELALNKLASGGRQAGMSRAAQRGDAEGSGEVGVGGQNPPGKDVDQQSRKPQDDASVARLSAKQSNSGA